MSAELIANMQGRIEQCRRLAKMIDDSRAEQSPLQMACEIEADMKKLQIDEAPRHSEEFKNLPANTGVRPSSD